MLTLAHWKLPAALCQPAGSVPRAVVTNNLEAVLPSSVSNVTATDWLPPLMAAVICPAGEALPATVSAPVVEYGIWITPVRLAPLSSVYP